MPRYTKVYNTTAAPQMVFDTVKAYLDSESFEYVRFEGENVFKKGNGWMTNPTYFKISFTTNTVIFEGWMKYAIMPGVYVGELSTTGFIGSAMKGPFKKRIAQIETILGNIAAQYPAAPVNQNQYQQG